ncbi:hypothetical protein Dimus_019403 [Dionaea muscipula]
MSKKAQTRTRMITRRSSSFPSPLPPCLRPAGNHRPSLPPPPRPAAAAANPNLTTSLYHTHLGLFILTWSTNLFGRSLRLHLLPDHHPSDHSLIPSLHSSSPSFHLSLKPFFFWNKSGSRPLPSSPGPHHQRVTIFWDLTRAKFGSGPEPESGFYIAVVADGEMTLLVGDSEKAAYLKTKAKPGRRKNQALVVRREHVFGSRFYSTKTNFGDKMREISIECNPNSDDPKLCIGFDRQRVLQVKHLKWKFRGNERIEVDGHPIQLSWDVYNWLFEDENDEGYALFTFRFEKKALFEEEDEEEDAIAEAQGRRGSGSGTYLSQRMFWSNDSCGLNFERKKMKKKLLMKTRSSSSSSLSSASSGCSSVMEWESVEENELKGPPGFSLLVYAWKN